MGEERLHARVFGRVQGVFYRASTVDEAERLGLTGWVRNRMDGSVELEAEGPRGALDELLSWARGGPPMASVSRVDAEWLPATGELGSFRVR